MQKPAPADHPIHELLRSRWSPRAFLPRPIAPATLRSLFEAARWAPSSSNEQPWCFVVAPRDHAADFDRLLKTLAASNQRWAHNAGALVLCTARTGFERTGKPNAHAWHDCGLALAQLLVEATSLGLSAHVMAGFDTELARQACAVPAGFDPVTVTAIGHADEPDSLPDELRTRELAPRQRRPYHEVVFLGAWGHPAPDAPDSAP